jgi:hypothetical protein
VVAKRGCKRNPALKPLSILSCSFVIGNGQVIAGRDGRDPDPRILTGLRNLAEPSFVTTQDIVTEVTFEVLDGPNAQMVSDQLGKTLGRDEVV